MGLIKMYAAAITYLVNGPGTTETAEGYVARPVRYSTINVNDLADHIAADSRIERSKIAVITDSLIKQITEMVLNGHAISVPHLGTFSPKIKSKLAPSSAEIDATSFVAKVNFRPSVELKRDLQSTRIEKVAPATPFVPVTAEEEAQNLIAYFDKLAVKIAKEELPGATDIHVHGTPLAELIQCVLPAKSNQVVTAYTNVIGHRLKVDYTDDHGVDQENYLVRTIIYKGKNNGNKYNPYRVEDGAFRFFSNSDFVGAYDDESVDETPVQFVKIETPISTE